MDVRLADRDGLGEDVVEEHVLLFGLDQLSPLTLGVFEECDEVQLAFGFHLLQHRVDDDEDAASSSDAAIKKESKKSIRNTTRQAISSTVFSFRNEKSISSGEKSSSCF